ncbi:type I glyceraldehyde-3-phosphate dehydrogenase [Salinimicrobium oceani]|uniref:Type I glyceraldehyde-3-phosphate dehydrogenase n=1 Tax=Salinimicrobium oceani TaxID=2722702 RepID=A0ABX1CY49_9FLAO|nr:type I glyceraldehyde-3-phosphate dehydrogenase [Salinimicrobium oceani]NJW51864.1 type I glyceraldehyde-3-phosphate dehydrogenase [Salinimicrobium oceani]
MRNERNSEAASGKIRIGINGFGRIGRNLFRLLLDHPQIETAVINDIAPASTLAHLLKYDSIHGVLKKEVTAEENRINVDGKSTPVFQESEPENIDWSAHKVDVVVECTGKFKTRTTLEAHLKEGVKKVILSVPPLDDSIKMIVLGVNEQILDGTERIISNASCTTNNAAPMLQVIHELATVKQAYITTVHSYTTDQSLHDQPHKDLRRARAAGQSIVPTTTGAAKALTSVFPQLKDVIGGCGIRVPVPNGSLTDMTLHVERPTSIEEINTAFKSAAAGPLKNILEYTEDPIVSIDINGNTHSCVFDAQMTSVVGGNLVKIIGWYDNEIGYSSRLIDLISHVTIK